MISGFLKPSPSPKTNYFHLWRHQNTETNQEQSLEPFEKAIFTNLKIGNPLFDIFGKDEHRKKDGYSLNKFLKS